jgi:phosphatidylglycerophosphate synthase
LLIAGLLTAIADAQIVRNRQKTAIGKDTKMTTQSAAKNRAAFASARRVNKSLTASMEKRALQWMAERAPKWLTSDQLTALGLGAQFGAGVCYALSRYHRFALLGAIVCIALNWLGDSMDGTLARVRMQQRPRYGFYVDHMVDVFGSIAMMCGLGFSGYLHWQTAIAMLVAFLLLSSESYLATYTLGCFELSQGLFGPTEIRILLIAGNIALLRSPYSTILGHRFFLFDVGGSIAAAGMLAMAVYVTARHTAELYRQEPVRSQTRTPVQKTVRNPLQKSVRDSLQDCLQDSLQ